MNSDEKKKHAKYMREYRQKNLEKMRVYEKAQSGKYKPRKLAYMAQCPGLLEVQLVEGREDARRVVRDSRTEHAVQEGRMTRSSA